MVEIFFLVFSLTAAHDLNAQSSDATCTWHRSETQEYLCGKATYIYRQGKCQEDIPLNLFCEKKFGVSADACAKDTSKTTLECYKKYILWNRNPDPNSRDKDHNCTWRPQFHLCEGKRYAHGQAACKSGIYKDLFCDEALSDSVPRCAEDKSDATMDCYLRLKGPRMPTVSQMSPGVAPARKRQGNQ